MSRTSRFIVIGIAFNALLSLIDLARGSTRLWDAAPLLLGSGPNVVAVPAIAFTGLGLALRPEYAKRVRRLTEQQLAVGSVVATVIGLLVREVVQRDSARLRFDWSDIAATSLSGSLCGRWAVRLLRTQKR